MFWLFSNVDSVNSIPLAEPLNTLNYVLKIHLWL